MSLIPSMILESIYIVLCQSSSDGHFKGEDWMSLCLTLGHCMLKPLMKDDQIFEQVPLPLALSSPNTAAPSYHHSDKDSQRSWQ